MKPQGKSDFNIEVQEVIVGRESIHPLQRPSMCLVESEELEAQKPVCAACSLGLLTDTNLRPLLRISGTVNTTFCFNVFLEPPRIFPVDSFWAFIFIIWGRGRIFLMWKQQGF